MLSIKTQDIASPALVDRQPNLSIKVSPSSTPPPPPSSNPPPSSDHDHDREHDHKQDKQHLQVMEICEELAPNQKPFSPEDSCDCNPEFAVICSFINVFGAKIDLQLNIEQLKDSIENQEILDDSLVDIHVKLFKKLRRYFVRDQWEKALIRFAHEYSYEHAQEIEQLGYLKTRTSVKLELLRRLLDVQFECDPKFKAAVNLDEADDLRTQPVGRDIKGNSYWYCVDNDSNFRIFSEEPLDHKSWKLVCKSSEGFHELLAELEKIKDDKVKGERQTEPYNPYPEIFSEYFTKSDNLKENQETIKQPIAKYKQKKGCRSALSKKSDFSPPIKQVDDDDDVALVKQELPLIKRELPLIKQEDSFIKQEPKTNSDEHIPITNPNSPSSAARASPGGNGSIDSQVKQTLDNILSKVVTSFEFFFRRSSEAHNDLIKLDHEEVSTKKEDEANVKPVKKRGGRREKAKVEELPRRSSSRIQQLQQKKITNYFESAKKEPEPPRETATTGRPRIIKDESRTSTTSNGHGKSSKRPKKDKQRWRAKGKKKLSWDKDDSDLSSISSPTESDNDESFMEEIDGALNPDSSNNVDYDEFAGEEEDNSDEPVIVKRARTARQSIGTELNGTLNSTSISMMEEDKPCGRCDKSDDAEWILLCDMCDDGYHTTCCVPPLMFVPDGDWFCPPCEHEMLTGKLKEILTNLDAILEAKKLCTTTMADQKKSKVKGRKKGRKLNYLDAESEIDIATSDKSFQASSESEIDEDEEEEVTEIDIATSDESFHASSESEIDEEEEEEEVTENDIATSDESFQASSESEIEEEEEMTEIDIATSDESFQASSESEIDEDEEEEVTEIDEETDSSIDELVANFKIRMSRKRKKKKKKKKGKVKYFSESDDDDDYY